MSIGTLLHTWSLKFAWDGRHDWRGTTRTAGFPHGRLDGDGEDSARKLDRRLPNSPIDGYMDFLVSCQQQLA